MGEDKNFFIFAAKAIATGPHPDLPEGEGEYRVAGSSVFGQT